MNFRKVVACALMMTAFVQSLSTCAADENETPLAVPVRKSDKKSQDAAKLDEKKGSVRVRADQFDPVRMAELVFSYTNRERQKASLAQFRNSEQLAQSAFSHSSDMAARDYFNHRSGSFFRKADVSDRVRATGLQTNGVAENIAMYPLYSRVTERTAMTADGYRTTREESGHMTYDEMAKMVVDQWMQSPGHRRNILDASLTGLGVGCQVGMHQGVPYVYFTQNFARL